MPRSGTAGPIGQGNGGGPRRCSLMLTLHVGAESDHRAGKRAHGRRRLAGHALIIRIKTPGGQMLARTYQLRCLRDADVRQRSATAVAHRQVAVQGSLAVSGARSALLAGWGEGRRQYVHFRPRLWKDACGWDAPPPVFIVRTVASPSAAPAPPSRKPCLLRTRKL